MAKFAIDTFFKGFLCFVQLCNYIGLSLNDIIFKQIKAKSISRLLQFCSITYGFVYNGNFDEVDLKLMESIPVDWTSLFSANIVAISIDRRMS
jgi:hypothetical protein